MENVVVTSTKQSGIKTIYATFDILKKAGGHLSGKEVLDIIREKTSFSDWEKKIYETTGYVRWESILHFYTINCIKSGFLRKNKGIWYLTDEGEKAMSFGPEKLFQMAHEGFIEWDKKRKSQEGLTEVENIVLDIHPEQLQEINLDMVEENAYNGIREHINRMNPYEFQDLVAALLRGMGYFTPFIAPKGKDGGIDILAYQDPLGIKSPRIKVQVKHKPTSSVPVGDVKSLKGVLNGDSEFGLFVTSGKFSSESERYARETSIHIRLMDIDEFIELWQQLYYKLSDEDKNLLPLRSIYFLGES